MTDKKNNFDKDINIPCKEQIIIDGVDVSQCCFHYYNKENKHKCIKTDIASTCDADCSYGAIYLKQQLARKTQECEELEKEQNEIKKFLGISHKPIIQRLEELHERSDKYKDKILELEQEYEELKKQLEFVRTHRTVIDAEKDHYRKECEELKKKLNTSEEWRIKAESLNEKQDLENTRYRKALEEIEEELKEDIYCESQECGCDDSEECLRCTKDLILDIINKAKGGEDV